MLKFEDLLVRSSKEGEQLPQQVMEGCGPATAATQSLQNSRCDQQLVGDLQRDHCLHHSGGIGPAVHCVPTTRLQSACQAAAREPLRVGASRHLGQRISLQICCQSSGSTCPDSPLSLQTRRPPWLPLGHPAQQRRWVTFCADALRTSRAYAYYPPSTHIGFIDPRQQHGCMLTSAQAATLVPVTGQHGSCVLHSGAR